MIRIDNVFLPIDTDFENLKAVIKETIGPAGSIVSVRLFKKAVDARGRTPRFCCSVLLEVKDEEEFLKHNKSAKKYEFTEYVFKKATSKPKHRPIVVGFGPAGMFAALTLAKAGLNPIVIERGTDIDTRIKDVSAFMSGSALKENSNIQFGEGGAGTFSDGKLNTGIKDFRSRVVLDTFAHHGANEDILYEGKPHIGTDVLRLVVKNIRQEIITLGGEVRFNTCLERIITESGRIKGIVAGGLEYKTENLFLCIGHSARDTFSLLKSSGVSLCRKPFAVGVRIEHLQSDINRALYGRFAGHKNLGAAYYKTVVHPKNSRSVYTFCMCPGGEVVNASSEPGGIVTNGMSYRQRSGINANSALLVGIAPEDIGGTDVLGGIYFQREIENLSYNACGGRVPVCSVGYFLGKTKNAVGRVKPTVKPDYELYDIGKLFPEFITESLKIGIAEMGKKIKGFDDNEAMLSAPETRSSSPVRIQRDENMQAVGIKGLFPCGEGAGYAGGIVSSAVDAIKAAEKLVNM